MDLLLRPRPLLFNNINNDTQCLPLCNLNSTYNVTNDYDNVDRSHVTLLHHKDDHYFIMSGPTKTNNDLMVPEIKKITNDGYDKEAAKNTLKSALRTQLLEAMVSFPLFILPYLNLPLPTWRVWAIISAV